MELLSLPIELVELVVPYTLPEGLEGLALSCKTLYTVCKPHFARYNRLSKLFRKFAYIYNFRFPTSAPQCPIHLLEWIADEPTATAFIRKADFTPDSGRRDHFLELIDLNGPVARIFERSFYLQAAGFNGDEYYRAVWEDASQHAFYSQRTSTFILTHLPNVQELALPKRWDIERDGSSKLVNAIVFNARSPDPRLMKRPSLGLLTTLSVQRIALDSIAPFLALPRLSYLGCYGMKPMKANFRAVTSEFNYDHLGLALETIELFGWSLDANALKELLEHTPRLKSLSLQSSNDSTNLSELVKVIAGTVGKHLEVLAIDLSKLLIMPQQRISFGDFTCLHTLAMTPPIILSFLASSPGTQLERAADTSPHTTQLTSSAVRQPWISDLLPSTVAVFKDSSEDDDATDLPRLGLYWRNVDVLLSHIIADKASNFSSIGHIKMAVYGHDDEEVEEWSRRITESARAVGIKIELEPAEGGFSFT